MPSSKAAPANGQVLGKRKYGQPSMRVATQFRNTGGSSSQVFHQRPSATEFSIANSTAMSRPTQPHPDPPATNSNSTKKAAVNDHSFVLNTVDSMKTGQRHPAKRGAVQYLFSDNSSVDSNHTTKDPPKIPRFRPSRPLQNSDQVYADVWINILSFAEPKFLLEARTINRHFYRLLQENTAIWRDSRINHYGPDMPSCPKGLSEKQFVELLAGRGCQNSKCSMDKTHKVHWMYQVRLCPNCLVQKTMRVDDLSPHRQYSISGTDYEISRGIGLELWELLPLARLDGRDSHLLDIDEATNTWARGQGNPRQFRFLTSSFVKLETEYQRLVNSDADDDVIKAWADKKHEETMELMHEAHKLESWSRQQTFQVQTTRAQDLRQARINYFEACARELSPPMDAKVLWKMAAFTGILKVRSQPTKRSWDELKPKIEPYRSHAEQVVDFEQTMDGLNWTQPQAQTFKRLHDHRCGRKALPRTYQPEQKIVLQLGETEFAKCLASNVADEDLLLLCLKNVFDSYNGHEQQPPGLNFDGTTGPYRLSLDDARMIVEDVMEKQIPRNSPRGKTVFQSLRCRGCRRTDHIRMWSFVEAFEHILSTHARQVGEGLEYYQFAKVYPQTCTLPGSTDEDRVEFKFPWYTTFWPRSLPFVPRHQDTSDMEAWHPAVPTKFTSLEKPPSTSAFEGRVARETEHTKGDFTSDLIYAAQKMYGLRLDGASQLKIALKFALDLYARKHKSEPAVTKFLACVDGLRDVNPQIELKFGCGVCVIEEKIQRSARQGQYKKPVDALEKHWAIRHHGGAISWTEGLMQLPTESEVLQQMLLSDKKLQAEKNALVQREMARSKDIKKRANSKASVVLQQQSVGDVFDQLFPRQE